MRVHKSLFLAHGNNVSVNPDDHHRTRPIGQKKAGSRLRRELTVCAAS